MDALYIRGVIQDGDITFTEVGGGDLPERVRVEGRLTLGSGSLLEVEKYLSVRRAHDGRVEVLAEVYSYQAWMNLPDGSRRDLFRYDNTDDNLLESLHRHRFYTDGRQTDLTEAVPHDALPYLSEVIEEADSLGYFLLDHLDDGAHSDRGAISP